MNALGPFALALIAGLVSFTSPCCLPLMPGYVSFIGGVGTEGDGRVATATRMRAAVLFVAGFAMAFTLMGLGASVFGGAILHHRQTLTRVAGAFVITMGLVTMGVLRIPILQRELRPGLARARPGTRGALPLGVAFAIGWTPCVGPVLAAILTAAAAASGAWRGAALLFLYSLGLGIPFLLLAWGVAGADHAFSWFRRHGRAIERAGGGLLVVMGVLMVTGTWIQLFTPILRLFSRSGWPPV